MNTLAGQRHATRAHISPLAPPMQQATPSLQSRHVEQDIRGTLAIDFLPDLFAVMRPHPTLLASAWHCLKTSYGLTALDESTKHAIALCLSADATGRLYIHVQSLWIMDRQFPAVSWTRLEQTVHRITGLYQYVIALHPPMRARRYNLWRAIYAKNWPYLSSASHQHRCPDGPAGRPPAGPSGTGSTRRCWC